MSVTTRLRNLFGSGDVYHISITQDAPPVVDGYSVRKLYATQANLHAVVSFLADSVAQLPLKVYVREGETERKRDRESTIAKLLWQPNADQTSYEFINAIMTEYLLFGSVAVWLLPDADSASGYQLRIIPREWIVDTHNTTNYAPDQLVVSASGNNRIAIDRKDYCMLRMYSPGNPGGWQSPIAALRQTLSEQIQADRFRTDVWSSSGRFNAYITRPKDVQPWDEEQRSKFVAAFREAWGRGGENAGKMPLLEDGMEIKPYQFNSKEAQYAETKQLSREDVAAAYHVNPSLIWHTTTQTYASAKDNARALYADCLGPIIQMIQQRFNSFLLPMVGADPNTYIEFDLSEKLKGSFEERASILQSAVGGPYMTRNEARADNNLPPIEGGDELIVPLNVVEGGQASPQDTHMDAQEPVVLVETGLHENTCDCVKCKSEPKRIKARSSQEEDDKMTEVLSKFFKRQADSILPKLGAKSAKWWDEDRWNEELADDIEPVMDEISDAHGKEMADALGTKFNTEMTRAWLRKCAEGRAKAINQSTYQKLLAALEWDGEDPEEIHTPAHVMEIREGSEAALVGSKLARDIAGWAALSEAIEQAELQGYPAQQTVQKRWVTGANAREEHALMNGETVGIDELFSNGCSWPGDDLGDPDTTCGCNCTTEVIITEA